MSSVGMRARPSTAYRSDFTDPKVHRLSVSGHIGFGSETVTGSEGSRSGIQLALPRPRTDRNEIVSSKGFGSM